MKKNLLFLSALTLAFAACKKNDPAPTEDKGCGTVSYGDETYATVIIGDQCWLARNLNVGDTVKISNPKGLEDEDPTEIKKYCYNDELANCDTYGGLYTWGEVMNYGKGGDICPEDWHAPSKEELETLVTEVGDTDKLLSGGESGFNALKGGLIVTSNGTSDQLGSFAYFSSSTEDLDNPAKTHRLRLEEGQYDVNAISLKTIAFSVRCIKD